jgi:hypothetical protein
MERIDRDTWRTDNGDEVRAQGLRVTVEFGEKTKAEVLCAVEAVRAENDKLRELVRQHVSEITDTCGDCWGGLCEDCDCWLSEHAHELRALGIEVE